MAQEKTASTTDQVSPVKDVEQKKTAPPAPEVSKMKPEPPAPERPTTLFEMADGPGKKDIPSPENVVIPFEKINEIKAEKEATSGKDAKAVDGKQPRPPAMDAVKKEETLPLRAKMARSWRTASGPIRSSRTATKWRSSRYSGISSSTILSRTL